MPLLRLKPFKAEVPSTHLTANDEVFLCDLTGEVFTNYESFYQRMILCNSLVWSCEISGKPNLTFKEAQESEKSIRKSLSAIPFSLKLGILYCVHHTRRSKIQFLTDEIYDYLKSRYQLDEKVEVKIKDKWTESIVSELPYSVDLNLQNKLNCQKSLLLNSGDEKLKAFNSILGSLKSKSPLENKELRTETSELNYKVLVLSGPKKGETIVQKGKSIRRTKKGVFAKDKVKLFLKQCCRRTTNSSDDGYWVVEKKEISKFGLGTSCIKPVILPVKNKKPKTVKQYMERPQDLALQQQQQRKMEQKRIEMELERGKKQRELDALREQKLKEKEEEKALREQKLKEKEEEKARKKDELKKERELNLERKNLELDFVREFNKVREDMLLEDSKLLPSLTPLMSTIDQELVGEAVMLVEFINTFGSLLGLEEEFDGKITLGYLEEALCEHDAEGNYFTIVKFLLHSYLRIDKEENNYKSDDEDDGSSSDNSNSPAQTQSNVPDFLNDASKKASANASAAAAWPMLHQGLSLSDISIEPFSLTEVLRLHILSSGVRIGGIDYNQWQRRGQYQLSDDPCVWFRHQEKEIMKSIMTSSVYDLSPSEKLKILTLLCNQTLMLSTVREHMEDATDKIKSLRKELRDVQQEENQRKRKIQQAKWKKKVEERKKVKEEMKLKKERKSLEAQQQLMLNHENSPATPGLNNTNSPSVDGTPLSISNIEISPNLKQNGNDTSIDPEDEKEQQEKELERKRKKEEKEKQIDDFHHEKFLFREKELTSEIAKYTAVISETPIGSDRFNRRYWNFNYVDGLLVENDEDAMFSISESESDDSDAENDGDVEMSDDEEVKIIEDKKDVPPKPPSISKVKFDDIMQAKKENIPLTRLILNRYNINYNERSEEIVQKSPAIKPLIENIIKGIDPRSYTKTDDKWYHISNKEQYEAITECLNNRGVRESILNTGLSNSKTDILNSFEEADKVANKKTRNMNAKSEESNDIDKSLFETMDDYIEGNLRDSLLEIEERLWLGNIGIIKVEDRVKWRTTIEQGMMKLIKYQSPQKEEPEADAALKEDSNELTLENGDKCVENGIDSSVDDDEMSTSVKSENALPLHLKTDVKDDNSRCSTPVIVPENERRLVVKELADALLLIEQGIEKRFLKPPLGESEDIKRGKMKEVIETSAEGEVTDDKKGSQCLTRWRESLAKCTSFAQIFIHLDTLDRSILWDKSIQNTKCRLCRRKGNEDEMLLCDGCDRGFHMSCLKPKLKTVPEGDWFCPDCRPIDIKRRNRKVSVVVEEETEEEESEEETEEEDVYSQSESQSDGEEDEEEDEDDDSVVTSEHGEHCLVCNEEGTLILCDECPRSYHVGCCYPRLKKVPRGNWCCQICTGLDLELPYKKRAITIERKRERELKELNKGKKNQKKKKKQQRGQADTKAKAAKEKKRNSSPLVNIKSAKKPRLDNDSSPRSTVMNRMNLKNCSTIIGEVFELEEAQDFLIPVDSQEVPDYYDFIDTPMDFGTIKRKLNTAKYVEIQDFLDDVNLIFQNCTTYNPPRSRVSREGAKLRAFVSRRIEELGLK